jgi:O-acetyl-ADP-ribose deacetylase (regulator of RNase III)
MKIIYKTGDLFKNNEKIIVHSCNILGGFGSGVAGVIAKLYPEVREEYIKEFNTNKLKLGSILWTKTKDGFVEIGNMMCQPTVKGMRGLSHWGERHVSYDAVDDAFANLDDEMRGKADFGKTFKEVINSKNEVNLFSVAMPLIGSALGGGSWSIISSIIEYRSKNFQPIVYTLDGKIPE